MKAATVLGLIAALAVHPSGCEAPPRPATPESPIHFSRITGEAGLHFHHSDGSCGRKYFPEVMGPGCAFVDLTGDDRPDIFLLNGAPLPGAPASSAAPPRFYVNSGDGTFTDRTESSGLGVVGYGIGCCAGDYDNDGRTDLYVTRLGRNSLYRNLGGGRFQDVTEHAGVAAGGFSSGAAFADYDGDGRLDLYVSRYVLWTPETNVVCTMPDGERKVPVYCRPSVYPPARGILYRNNGDGTFSDVTAAAGLAVKPGRGLGAIWADVNDDGKPDLFVANDMSEDFLFINQGKGRFREEATALGTAVGENGQPQASMGVAAADYDGDGRIDLACTNFSGEYLAIYHNQSDHFEDVSAQSGVAGTTSRYVGFGLGFPDLNLDGRPDLFVANGHVTEGAERFYPGITFAQPSLCFLGGARGGFTQVPDAGTAVTSPRVSRGVAFADVDGDGDLDVLVANWRGEPDLLRNDAARGSHWVRLRLSGARANRSAIGARVEVTADGRKLVQEVQSGSSYCSQSDLGLTFGLATTGSIEQVRVRWPGGRWSTWKALAVDRTHHLVEGTEGVQP